MKKFSYEVFLTVVLKRTFQQAAELLNVTPSAVSHSISQLENEIGFPLLFRKRSGIELTDGGKKVLPYVKKIVDVEENLKYVVDDIHGLNSGSIKLGGISSVCVNWLPEIIGDFHQHHPKVQLSVKQGSFSEITEWVKSGIIDIGFTSMPVNENLMVFPLIDDPIFCIVPNSFSPKNGLTMTESDVVNTNLILQQSDCEYDTHQILDYYHVENQLLKFSVDDSSIVSMVEAGLGFGILPKLALQKLTGDVKCLPFSKNYHRKIVLITGKSKSPATKEMLTVIKKCLARTYNKSLIWQ